MNLVGFSGNRLSSFFEEMQRPWDRWSELWPFEPEDSWWLRSPIEPTVEMEESEDRFIVRAEMPGLRKEDIDVRLRDNILQIRGERRQADRQQQRDFLRLKQSAQWFVRNIELPAGIQLRGARAKYRDGVLEVTLKKRETDRGRRIPLEGVRTISEKIRNFLWRKK